MDMKICPFGVTVTGIPAEMAGREEEENDISAAIERVVSPADRQPGATIIFGPRGVGKASLVRWMMKEAKARRVRYRRAVDVLHFPDPETLAIAMADPAGFHAHPPSRIARLREKLSRRRALAPVSSEKGAELHLSIPAFVKLITRYGRRTDAREHDDAEPIQEDHAARMIQRCRKKPLLILIDEAHHLDGDFKKNLASLAYRVTYDGTAGFHLVLAGTPPVNRWEGFDEISYSERYTRMPLGTLDPDSAMRAIAVPFDDYEITVHEDVLNKVAADSYGYPTFIQTWGRELWRVAEAPGASLTMEHLENAREKVDRVRAGMYGRRIERIEKKEDRTPYLAAHYAAASAMEKNSWALARPPLERAVGVAVRPNGSVSAAKAEAKKMLERLEDVDFVWRPHDAFEPGIPSFMSYVIDYVRSNEPNMAAEIDRMLPKALGRGGHDQGG